MNNVVLIGFMGCGKSTVGIRLSYRLRRIVEDTDKLIEKRAGMTISEIFDARGEEGFRQMETECLKELCTQTGERIVSTGGGLPMREENRALLKKLGCVVYLRISPECVWERLKDDTSRPLLQCENPTEKIRTLMEARAGKYETAADLIVDVDGKDMEQVVAEILAGLAACGVIKEQTEEEIG